MDIDKIRKRKSMYENGKNLLLEKYATDPTLEKQIEETNLILDTLDFCLYCIGEANQYNAVVAQNKSLQSELNIYKKSLEKAAEDILFLLNHSNIFDYKYYESKEEAIVDYKKQALQELEAENGLH